MVCAVQRRTGLYMVTENHVDFLPLVGKLSRRASCQLKDDTKGAAEMSLLAFLFIKYPVLNKIGTFSHFS